jgi:stage II sporulation SpoE-like protein
MKRQGPRNLWFNLAVGLGAALGVLLLVQSILLYFQVSKDLVTAELARDAQEHVTEMEREIRQLGAQTPEALGQEIGGVQQEEASKIAWIKVLDSSGQTIVQSGTPVGPNFDSQQIRLASSRDTPILTIRDTPAGPVMVNLFSVRLIRRREATEPTSEPPASSPQFVEIALYWNNALENFSRLRTREVISSLAALALVGTVIVLWLRFPHYLHGMQLKQQAELAQSVQAELLLARASVFHDLTFAAACVPAWQVGGDLYDVFSADQGRVAIAIGDVSGNGLPASVLAGVLVGAIRTSGWLAGSVEQEASSRQLNELLCARTTLDRFATLFWSYYEPGEKILRYVNAGHPYPILLRRNGAGRGAVQRLEEGGPVLGLLAAAEYRQGAAPICPGDLLVLYSDGVTEAPNTSEEEFGEERLLAAIEDCAQKSAAEIRDEILRRVRSFIGEKEVQDDLTLVVVRFQAHE